MYTVIRTQIHIFYCLVVKNYTKGHFQKSICLFRLQCESQIQVRLSLSLQKRKSCHFFFSFVFCRCLHSPVNKYLRQSSSSSLLYQRDSKSSLGCIHCYLILCVTLHTTHTHRRAHISLSTPRTSPRLQGCSIFHNVSCNIVRYGLRFHLCGAAAAHLSRLGRNGCGSVSLARQSQTDGGSTCRAEPPPVRHDSGFALFSENKILYLFVKEFALCSGTQWNPVMT